MKKENKPEGKGHRDSYLRNAAEKSFARSPDPSLEMKEKKSEELLQELQVHQIELEMQNEELRKAQLALEESGQRYADLYDFAPVGYFSFTPEALIKEVNLTGATLLGVARQKLINVRFRRIVAAKDQDRWDQHFLSVLQQEEKQTCDLTLKRQDGSTFQAGLESIRMEVSRGAFEVHTMVTDVTERKRAGKALRASEEHYRILFDEALDGICMADAETGIIIDCNQELAALVCRERTELIGRPQKILYPLQDEKAIVSPTFKQHLTDKEGQTLETQVVTRTGDIREVKIKANFLYLQGRKLLKGIFRDITERKRAEHQIIETLQQLQETRDMLIQFEKHAAVGRLAAGVAHEILNPASIISSRLQFLKEENLSEPARENLRVCREQIQRIVKISRELGQSSAKQPGMLVGGDLRRVIDLGLQMTEPRIKEDHVQVEYHPPPEVIPVKMKSDSMVKVMVNLILNACDAMTGNQQKRLIVTVHRPEVSSKSFSILLIVGDNGYGIPAGNLNLIFEPFFTTKDPGKGTGLGLSVCKGIIQEHGGTIHAENNDMGGASFIVELPPYHP